MNEISLDPEVGYFGPNVYNSLKNNKGGAPNEEVIVTQKSTIQCKCVRPLDIVSEVTVIIFIVYASYKTIKHIKNIDLNFNIDI